MKLVDRQLLLDMDAKQSCPACGSPVLKSGRAYCSQACANATVAQQREADKLKGETAIVWSCGGGVQSSAIAALIIQGKLRRPDYAVMVDVGYEKASTWETVYDYLVPGLAEIGVELNIIKTTDYRTNEIFDPQGHLRLPAYRRLGQQIGKLHTHCSATWKMQVAMKWMREQGLRKVQGWIGISTDEARRKKPSTFKWYTLAYPLLRLGLSRLDCHRILWEQGWDRVRHSSCYICPQQNNEQWLMIESLYKQDWANAIGIDEGIRQRDETLYLHRSGLPLTDWLEQHRKEGFPGLFGPCETDEACVDCL